MTVRELQANGAGEWRGELATTQRHVQLLTIPTDYIVLSRRNSSASPNAMFLGPLDSTRLFTAHFSPLV